MSGADVVEFQGSLYNLTDHPDKNVIDQLTYFAQANKFALAQEIVNSICTRLLDVTIPSSYKLPIFYLMDSIMKRTREPYVPLFSLCLNQLDVSFFQQFSEQHRVKFEKLFGTWEERNLISIELLNKLRVLLSQAAYSRSIQPQHIRHEPIRPTNHFEQVYTHPNAATYNYSYPYGPVVQAAPDIYSNTVDTSVYASSQANQFYPHQSIYHAPPTYPISVPSIEELPRVDPIMPGKRQRDDKRGIQNMPSNNSLFRAPNTNLDGRRDTKKPVDPRENGKKAKISQDLPPADPVKLEMEVLLKQLLTDLGQDTNNLSLEELQVENLQLYQQLQSQAELIVNGRNPFSNYANVPHTGTADASLLQTFPYNNVNLAPVDNSTQQEHFASTNNGVILQQQATDWQNHQNYLLGFISETPVTFTRERADYLTQQLTSSTALSNLTAETLAHCRQLTSRIANYIKRIDVPSRLPDILFGSLPVEPTRSFMDRMNPVSTSANLIKKIVMPMFRIEELTYRPDNALKALYADRPYLAEDGQRFASPIDFRKHTDRLIAARIEKKKQQLRGEASTVERRAWYSTSSSWTGEDKKKSTPGSQEITSNNLSSTSEEYVVPADENFVRCPISKEAFEKVWNDNEGEYMYRNAVKLLVTQSADENVYSLGKATASASVRYLIVRKPLIVDGWIKSGAATTLPNAIMRYRSMGKEESFIRELSIAAGDDDELDDIFVLIESVR